MEYSPCGNRATLPYSAESENKSHVYRRSPLAAIERTIAIIAVNFFLTLFSPTPGHAQAGFTTSVALGVSGGANILTLPWNNIPVSADAITTTEGSKTAHLAAKALASSSGIYLGVRADNNGVNNNPISFSQIATSYSVSGGVGNVVAEMRVDGSLFKRASLILIIDVFNRNPIYTGIQERTTLFINPHGGSPNPSTFDYAIQAVNAEFPQGKIVQSGQWDGSLVIPFNLLRSDSGILHLQMQCDARNNAIGSSETPAYADFLNTATLDIKPTGNTTVTLGTGQVFVVAAAPEPSAMALLLCGVGAMAGVLRRRQGVGK